MDARIHHATSIGNFIHDYCSVRVSLLRVRFLDSGTSPILVVEITYDFRLRVETGTGRPLIVVYSRRGKYKMIWVRTTIETRTKKTLMWISST